MLLALTLVVLISASDGTEELALHDAAQAALGERSIVSVRVTAVPPDTRAAAEQLGADAVAVVEWLDAEHRRAAVLLYQRVAQDWLRRTVDFGAGDSALEKARSAAGSGDQRCHMDSDCGDAALRCDVVSHRCVACRTDADCSGGAAPRCDLVLHRCVECGADIDCAAGSSCEATTRRCVIECAEGISEHASTATLPTGAACFVSKTNNVLQHSRVAIARAAAVAAASTLRIAPRDSSATQSACSASQLPDHPRTTRAAPLATQPA